MDTSLLLLALASFLGSLLLVSRVGSWLALLASLLRSSTSEENQRAAAPSIAPLLLHSGPWALIVAGGAIYYASTRSETAYLWAVLVGLALAVVLVGGFTVFALWRHSRPTPEPRPLTPDRLFQIERRFFWCNSLFTGAVALAIFSYELWDHMTYGDLALLVIAFWLGFGTGWFGSWFMWQWYGASLEANERARQLRQKENVV